MKGEGFACKQTGAVFLRIRDVFRFVRLQERVGSLSNNLACFSRTYGPVVFVGVIFTGIFTTCV